MPTHKLYSHLIGGNEPLGIDLVGAGGNGSQMLTGLARMHVALQAVGHAGLHVCVYDSDRVTEANVGRQLFSPSDVGQPKASVLVNRINAFYGLDWRAHCESFGTPYAHQQPAFIIGCVDTIASRKAISRSRYYYWLDVGNRDKTGQVILGRAKWKDNGEPRPKTFFEMFPELARRRVKEDNTPSCSLAGALERQDLFINQAVVTWGLHLLWSFLRNGSTDINGYFINLQTGIARPIPLEPYAKESSPKPVTSNPNPTAERPAGIRGGSRRTHLRPAAGHKNRRDLSRLKNKGTRAPA